MVGELLTISMNTSLASVPIYKFEDVGDQVRTVILQNEIDRIIKTEFHDSKTLCRDG